MTGSALRVGLVVPRFAPFHGGMEICTARGRCSGWERRRGDRPGHRRGLPVRRCHGAALPFTGRLQGAGSAVCPGEGGGHDGLAPRDARSGRD